MPIYEYSCRHCGKTFEDWLRPSEEAENRPCPDCGALCPRVISNTSFILKGGGWFASSYGHGTSNLFDKSKGVPSVSDSKPEEGSSPAAHKTDSPAPAKAAEKTAGTKEKSS